MLTWYDLLIASIIKKFVILIILWKFYTRIEKKQRKWRRIKRERHIECGIKKTTQVIISSPQL